MPNVAWNKLAWDGYSWPDGGEIWSERWGCSEAQWFGSIYPRLHRFLPTCRVLEIAPGFGRWSRFLVRSCSQYIGIDLSEKCIEACTARFRHDTHARFVVNDGTSLDAAEDGLYDFVFSFDLLVHAELDVFENYVPQLMQKLTPSGIAFIHHSNLADLGPLDGMRDHGRGRTVSGSVVERLVQQHGGTVLIQEVINWVDTGLIDCLTTFSRKTSVTEPEAIKLVNSRFMLEAELIKVYQAPYSATKSC